MMSVKWENYSDDEGAARLSHSSPISRKIWESLVYTINDLPNFSAPFIDPSRAWIENDGIVKKTLPFFNISIKRIQQIELTKFYLESSFEGMGNYGESIPLNSSNKIKRDANKGKFIAPVYYHENNNNKTTIYAEFPYKDVELVCVDAWDKWFLAGQFPCKCPNINLKSFFPLSVVKYIRDWFGNKRWEIESINFPNCPQCKKRGFERKMKFSNFITYRRFPEEPLIVSKCEKFDCSETTVYTVEQIKILPYKEFN